MHTTGQRFMLRQPVFYAFDLLWLDGEDVRPRPLEERKRLLRSIAPEQPSVLLYANHIERTGIDFFRLACEQDLEGIVAKELPFLPCLSLHFRRMRSVVQELR
jgi:ATP-dependent DNA ligase